MHRGGAELRTLELMRYVDRSRFQMDFCALSGRTGSLDHEIAKLGGVVYYCNVKNPAFPFRFLRLLREQRYDIVHSHVFLTSGALLLLARCAHVRGRIAHFRSSQSGRQPNRLRQARDQLLRWLLNWNATKILGVSASALDIAWGHNWRADSRCQVVYNGIAVDEAGIRDRSGVRREFGIPENAWLIIHVGSLRPPKNHEKLLNIFAQLVQKKDNAYLLIVGEGELRRQIELQIESLELEQRAIMTGERNDVLRLYSGADLMIFPSLWEGLPGSVLESLACGVPVLASDIPVMREVRQYFPALSIQAVDAPVDAWAASAMQIAASDYSDPARQWRESPFTMQRCVANMSTLWQEIGDGKR